jgi:hypothetical protein
MQFLRINRLSRIGVSAVAGLVLAGVTGCQTNVGGQRLPSAYYLRDDVQFFPAGPEDKIANERRALEQYKAGLEQPAVVAPVAAPGPPPAAPPAPNPAAP